MRPRGAGTIGAGDDPARFERIDLLETREGQEADG